MAEPIDEYFTATIAAMSSSTRRRADDEPVRDGSSLTTRVCLALFDVQLGSRHLDLAARWLRAQGRGYYTIGSSGHEGNAAVAAALRPTDPALLHYRSGAFFLARGVLVDGREPLRDVLLGLVAATDEPISGGRHKVFGRHDLHIIPQTSTIASHLPRALGVAFSIARARKLGVTCAWPDDAVDGVQLRRRVGEPLHRGRSDQRRAALRVSGRADAAAVRLRGQRDRHQRARPRAAGSSRATETGTGLAYFGADGCDLPATFDAAAAAADWVRTRRRPAFLHLRTVRLMGHAGSDYEAAYRRPDEIAADYERDPLVRTAHCWSTEGVLTPSEVLDRYEAKRAAVMELGRTKSMDAAQLDSAGAVMAPLARGLEDALAAAPASLARIGSSRRPRRADDRGDRDQPRARRHPRPLPGGHRLRRGRRAQRRRVRGHPRTAQPERFGAGVRHAARRAVDPRAGAGRRGVRAASHPRDPVPGLSAQRRGPDPR